MQIKRDQLLINLHYLCLSSRGGWVCKFYFGVGLDYFMLHYGSKILYVVSKSLKM